MVNLEELHLCGNPLAVTRIVEGFVILACPKLRRLGPHDVTPSVRHEVERWSQATPEGSDVAQCVAMFRTAFREGAYGAEAARTSRHRGLCDLRITLET